MLLYRYISRQLLFHADFVKAEEEREKAFCGISVLIVLLIPGQILVYSSDTLFPSKGVGKQNSLFVHLQNHDTWKKKENFFVFNSSSL